MTARSGVRRPSAERHLQRHRLVGRWAVDLDLDLIARLVLEEQVDQRVVLVDALAVDRGDDVALADAGIASWDAAYDVDFWRPVTAVAFESDPFNPDADSNPLTSGELGWTPLLNTPDFPEYASSSAALGSAAGTVLAAFFGDNVNFTADSDVFGDGTFIMSRSFSSFSEAADEAGMSQVYGGVTFNSSVTDGQTIGENVGDQVMANNFAPVPEPSGALLIAAAGLVIILRRRMGR